jgi:hypothetical protein
LPCSLALVSIFGVVCCACARTAEAAAASRWQLADHRSSCGLARVARHGRPQRQPPCGSWARTLARRQQRRHGGFVAAKEHSRRRIAQLAARSWDHGSWRAGGPGQAAAAGTGAAAGHRAHAFGHARRISPCAQRRASSRSGWSAVLRWRWRRSSSSGHCELPAGA